jgi:hypothetical protein
MNSAPISFNKRRRWWWLFAALLPYALYGFLKEQQSWKPRTIRLPIQREGWSHIKWLKDGRMVCFYKNKVSLIDISTGKTEKTISYGRYPVGAVIPCIDISADRKTIFIGADTSDNLSRSGEIRVVNALSGNLLRVLKGDRSFDVDGSKLYTIYEKNERSNSDWPNTYEVRVYNWKTGRLLSKVPLSSGTYISEELPADTFYATAWSKNHKYVVGECWGRGEPEGVADSGERCSGIGVFEIQTGKLKQFISGHKLVCASSKLFFLHEVYSPSNNRIELWNLNTLEKIASSAWPSDVSIKALSPDGQYVVGEKSYWGSYGILHDIQVRQCQTGQLLREIKLEPSIDADMLFSPDGRTLAVRGYQQNTVALHRIK